MKKLISVFLAMALILTNFQGWEYLKKVDLFERFDLFQGLDHSFAQEGILLEGTGLYYSISDEKVTITNADASISGDLVIPETIEGYHVTSIGSHAFKDCSDLISIEIPNGVNKIGDSAFWGCSSLEKINIPENVTRIGSSAFEGCNLLSGNINIPKGVTAIENNTFRGCELLSNINIPKGVTSIGDSAFEGCKSLQSIELPKELTSIGNFAFRYCGGLTDIQIPNKLTIIAHGAFEECRGLTSINIPSGVITIEGSAFSTCTNLGDIEIPDTVTSIGDAAFAWCISLTSIVLSKNITSIESNTFSTCYNLKNIEIPNGVTTIGLGAFWACYGLENIELPESVTSIRDSAFYSCSKLASINIPKSVTNIEKGAFSNCTNLIIYGEEDSYAQTYADTNGIKFVSLKDVAKVNFDLNNGENPVEKMILKGSTLNYTPENPTKNGYQFVGWYKDVGDITTEYKSGDTYTEDVTYTAKYAHVQMLGSQGKMIVDDKSGIRFGTKIYNDGDEMVEKGTLIIPASVLGDEELTLETSKAVKSVANVLYDQNEEENYVTYLGTLINIPRSQFATEITASSYVIYKDKAGNEYTVYSPYKNGSITVNKLLGL